VSTLFSMAAALATGLFLGCVAAAAFAAAARSRSQERMQRKVLYWQAEAARARADAEQLARRLAAHDRWPKPPAPPQW
jgi:hypothetical protein